MRTVQRGGDRKAMTNPMRWLVIAMVGLGGGGGAAVAESGRDLDEQSFRRPSQPIAIQATDRIVVDELRTRGIRTESRSISGRPWPAPAVGLRGGPGPTQPPAPVAAQPGFDPARRGIVPLSVPTERRLDLNPALKGGINRRPEIRERDLRRR